MLLVAVVSGFENLLVLAGPFYLPKDHDRVLGSGSPNGPPPGCAGRRGKWPHDQRRHEAELSAERRARLARLEIKAPVAGGVHDLKVFGPRSVVRPAAPLLYILPLKRRKSAGPGRVSGFVSSGGALASAQRNP